MSQNDSNLSEDELMGVGCLLCILLSVLDLAVSICVGALFSWPWGFAFYFGSIGLFGLFIIRVALKGGAK